MGADFSPRLSPQPEPNPNEERLPEIDPFASLYRKIHLDRLAEGPRVVREGFRPLIQLSLRGADEVVFDTLQRAVHDRENLSPSDIAIATWEVAEANFHPETEGYRLIEKMMKSFFARDWQRFSYRERLQLAYCTAAEMLPDDRLGQRVLLEYMTMQLNRREEAAMLVILAARGFRITEVVRGELWATSTSEPHFDPSLFEF
ncbi:MAG: hypothetical protein RL417_1170 [Pseudomonadota bacterium]|jgi:hypothetical protein